MGASRHLSRAAAGRPDLPEGRRGQGNKDADLTPRRETGLAGTRGTPGPPRGGGRDLPAPEYPAAEASLWGSTDITGKMGVKIGVASSYLESALTIRWSRDQPSWKLISGRNLAGFRRNTTAAPADRGVARGRAVRDERARAPAERATVVGKRSFIFL